MKGKKFANECVSERNLLGFLNIFPNSSENNLKEKRGGRKK